MSIGQFKPSLMYRSVNWPNTLLHVATALSMQLHAATICVYITPIPHWLTFYRICSNRVATLILAALWDLRNFFDANLSHLSWYQLFLGSAYLIGTYCHMCIQYCKLSIESIYRASGLDVKLGCLLHRALTYYFDVFLELGTTILMATVPATWAWFSDQSESGAIVFATEIFTATKLCWPVMALGLRQNFQNRFHSRNAYDREQLPCFLLHERREGWWHSLRAHSRSTWMLMLAWAQDWEARAS